MKGILLVNVGTPASESKCDVQAFIRDMLSDPLLTDRSEWVSRMLAKNIIAPMGAAKSSEKYRLIWRKEEPKISPITYNMQKLAETLEQQKNIPVEIAMRYGLPNVQQAIRNLERKCPLLHEVIVFPMYPHYAQSTTQTITDHIGSIFYKRPHSFRMKFVESYYNHPAYIQALATIAKPYLKDGIDKVVFSFHSLPLNQVETAWRKGKEFDYVYQLKETCRLLREQFELQSNQTVILYSSQRSNKWLKPYLDANIGDLPAMGWNRVAVMAPGFTVDNLETLYDIDILARDLFMKAGGKEFIFVPSLNYEQVWVDAIWKIISRV